MKYINFSIKLLIIFFCCINLHNIADAKVNINQNKSIIKNITPSNPIVEKDTSYLTKRTNLSDNEIYSLYKQGLNREDIKSCYIFKLLSDNKFADIVSTYLSEKKDINLTLKDLKIENKLYKEKYDSLFPINDKSNHDLVNKNKPLYRQAPPFN